MVLCHFQSQLLAAQNVEVQVMHGLTGMVAAVGDHTVAVSQAFGGCDPGDHLKDVSHHRGILSGDAAAAFDVGLGYYQHMDRCLGSDVPEGVDGLILVNLGGRNVAGDDFAE